MRYADEAATQKSFIFWLPVEPASPFFSAAILANFAKNKERIPKLCPLRHVSGFATQLSAKFAVSPEGCFHF